VKTSPFVGEDRRRVDGRSGASMSSFVWMKVLESSPERYDRGIRLLSGGRIAEVYELLAERAAGPGRRVLDLGCGTGAVSLACAARGARVVAIDRDAGMLEVARQKPLPAGPGAVRWINASAAEIEDHVPSGSLDAVVSCLAFSEMGGVEQDYALRASLGRLRPGGLLAVADECPPRSRWRRAWLRLRRLPLAVAVYALTQATTRAVEGLADRVRAAGFVEVHVEELWEGFELVTGRRGEGAP
jgi:ubiquinone/menaquinone biosynthesis C-methylase UbiE